MAKVKLETWIVRTEGTDEMGRVFTFGGEVIGHLFEEGKYVTVRSEYAALVPLMIKAVALEVGPSVATAVLRDVRIVP